jgi:hypothetical protein
MYLDKFFLYQSEKVIDQKIQGGDVKKTLGISWRFFKELPKNIMKSKMWSL